MSAGAARRVTALLGLSLVLAAFVPAASAAPAVEAATPPARIRVAADNSYPPYFFVEEDGSVQGYEADLWRLFERHTGIRVDLLPMPWEDTQRAVLAALLEPFGQLCELEKAGDRHNGQTGAEHAG